MQEEGRFRGSEDSGGGKIQGERRFRGREDSGGGKIRLKPVCKTGLVQKQISTYPCTGRH